MVAALDADLSVLGPVGASVTARLGGVGTQAVAAASLATWTAGGWLAGRLWFSRATS